MKIQVFCRQIKQSERGARIARPWRWKHYVPSKRQ